MRDDDVTLADLVIGYHVRLSMSHFSLPLFQSPWRVWMLGQLTQEILDQLNVSQATHENKQQLDELGSVEGLAGKLKVNLATGLTDHQVKESRAR